MRRLEIEPAAYAVQGAPAEGPGQPRLLEDSRNGDIARRIEQSITYMKEHLDQPLQAATLAARANISLSHYFALFKCRTGCSPIGYFTRLRMDRACHLLEGTSLTVKEVAAALGYEDPFYFSRVFKSINEVAPSRYRVVRPTFARAGSEAGFSPRLRAPANLSRRPGARPGPARSLSGAARRFGPAAELERGLGGSKGRAKGEDSPCGT